MLSRFQSWSCVTALVLVATSHVAFAQDPGNRRSPTKGRVALPKSEVVLASDVQSSLSMESLALDVAPDLQAIYQRSENAKSISDYSVIVDACQTILRDSNRPSTERNYCRTLLSWAANKRGEMRSDLAAERVRDQRLTDAEKLDQAAMADFQLAIDHDATRWRAHHNLGIAYALMGKTQEAINCFTETIQLNPNFVDAWNNRAELHTRAGRPAEAIKDYSKAIELDPTASYLFTARAHAKFAIGKATDALSDYESAMNLTPEVAAACVDYADTCQSLGKWKQAAEAYRKAMELEPTNARALQNAAWMMATCPDDFFRNPEAALETAQRAVESASEGASANLLDVFAAAQASNGDFKGAVATIQSALKLTTDTQLRKELLSHQSLYQRKKAYLQPATN